MDEIINVVKQTVKSVDVVPIVLGLFFIIIAIVVGVFKQYWLIAGVNTAPKKELEKIDLDYVGKYFGLFLGVFGGIIILGSIICGYLNIMKHFHRFMPFAIFAFVAFLFLHGHIKKDRIYKKNERNYQK